MLSNSDKKFAGVQQRDRLADPRTRRDRQPFPRYGHGPPDRSQRYADGRHVRVCVD